MNKLTAMTVSAMFALGAAQIANAANDIGPDGVKFNFSNGNAFGQDNVNVPGENMGLGNAFGSRDKFTDFDNNSIRNTFPQDFEAPNNGLGNSFGPKP